jgi:hypothetical protein
VALSGTVVIVAIAVATITSLGPEAKGTDMTGEVLTFATEAE